MAKPNVNLTVRSPDDGIRVIDIGGEITAFAENALMDAYTEANLGEPAAIVLNFSGLDYMNSSGIGLLVTLLIRVQRRDQKLLACGLSEHYRQIFELTRLNEAIGVFSSESEALQAAQAGIH